MIVHFIGSLAGEKALYKKILSIVEAQGFEVLTRHSITRSLAEVAQETLHEAEEYYIKMRTWIQTADVVVVEATVSDFGTGFEIATSLATNKPTIVLYNRKLFDNTPHVIKGLKSEKLQLIQYSDSTLETDLAQALHLATNQVEVRFHLLLNNESSTYVQQQAEKTKMSKSQFIRTLIEEHKGRS